MEPSNIYVINKSSMMFSNKECKIEIPKSVVHIGEEAFFENKKIRKVTIHHKVRKIDTSAFEGCEKLERVKMFGDSELVVIPKKCFKNCKSLKAFEIPEEVGVIKKYAFSGCTGIKHIVLPKHIIAVEAGAFDKWTQDQTIEMYSNFKFGLVCKAKIINHSLNNNEVIEDEVYETRSGKYMYSVRAKCGHVGIKKYMLIDFAVIASSKKEAAAITRNIGRVKHNHKDAIFSVTQISKREYDLLCQKNMDDPYLKMKNSSEQKGIKDVISVRTLDEKLKDRNNQR